MDIKKDFGLRVKELRKAKGWSQEKLATQAGLHYNYIGMIERAERNITLENVSKIAYGLGVDIPALFCFSKTSNTKETLIAEILKELYQNTPSQLSRILRVIKSL